MTFDTPIHTNEQSIDRVLGAGLPVLLAFWTPGCAPCDRLNPVLHTVAGRYAGKLLVARVNARENPALARRYSIVELPALRLIQHGQAPAEVNGAVTDGELAGWLDALLNGDRSVRAPHGPSIPFGSQWPTAAQPQPPSGNGHARPTSGSATSNGAHEVGGPVVLTDATFDQVIQQSQGPVLVDFWAPWCGPCRMVAPAVERLAQEFAGRAVVAKLNVDEQQRTAHRFGITSIPALYIFKGGQVVERLIGAQPGPALRQALQRHLG